jgi:hypothetical protein
MMKSKGTVLLLLPLLLIFSVYVLAAQGDAETLFTDNISATGPTPGITVMEQERLDRLNSAVISINVAGSPSATP